MTAPKLTAARRCTVATMTTTKKTIAATKAQRKALEKLNRRREGIALNTADCGIDRRVWPSLVSAGWTEEVVVRPTWCDPYVVQCITDAGRAALEASK